MSSSLSDRELDVALARVRGCEVEYTSEGDPLCGCPTMDHWHKRRQLRDLDRPSSSWSAMGRLLEEMRDRGMFVSVACYPRESASFFAYFVDVQTDECTTIGEAGAETLPRAVAEAALMALGGGDHG